MTKRLTSKQSKEEVAKTMASAMGISVEEALKLLPKNEDLATIPNEEQKMFEAQSVINYFQAKGRGFYHRKCRICGEEFAYAYPYPGITMCSPYCMAIQMASIGLEWDPDKPLRDRYGPTMPGVVPPQALKLLRKIHENVKFEARPCPKTTGEVRESPKRKVDLPKDDPPPDFSAFLSKYTSEISRTVEPQDLKVDRLEDLDELLDL